MTQVLLSSAARRYAKALFLSAQDGDCIEAVSSDMSDISEKCSADHVADYLVDPRLSAASRVSLVCEDAADLHSLVTGLLEVLKRKKRLSLLPEIPLAFRQYQDGFEGRLRGTLESSHPIAEEEHASLEAAFSISTGKKVTLVPSINAALLGGICVTLSGTRYDGSARGRLEQFRSQLSTVELA